MYFLFPIAHFSSIKVAKLQSRAGKIDKSIVYYLLEIQPKNKLIYAAEKRIEDRCSISPTQLFA